ncbi:unnamed protein product [Arabidopsis arenosa]|uniref:DNA topoisomerase 2 n=1 Tax=Arabidopsis arenosa TaxID=38785 RepID=A0A8S2AV13_ARAAE|nr:unnamed protein product [Arabidopsis arenosa]
MAIEYTEMSLPEHILLHPDLYLGSTKEQTQTVFVYENGEMVKREVNFVPAFLRIIDEILINAADNKQRDPCMDSLRVFIDDEKGKIRIYNSGSGIPVIISDNEYYIPHILFGRILATSVIHDDNEKKITGGRNGLGAKLTNIFSSEFKIETADGENKFTKVFRNNMKDEDDHLISSCKDTFTQISFTPDLQKLNMKCFGESVVSLIRKRVLEVANFLGNSVKVELNGVHIPSISFTNYVGLYLNSSKEPDPLPRIAEEFNVDGWDVCVTSSDGEFQQFSFVNSVATINGGTHVDYVTSQLTNHIVEIAKRKNKNTHLKTHVLMSHLWVFVNARIDNPTFDFPKREKLTSEQSSFISKGELSEVFLKKVAKSAVVEKLLSLATFKQRLTIENLVDANHAGGDLSQKCTLILTEGDSAKALPMVGMSALNRNLYGVYPLRGKLINVKKASEARITKNKVIRDIMEIIGLKKCYKKYKNTKSLRYGRLMIMTDQDHDGTHIKGLIINLFHTFWPSLLELSPSFIVEFITPLVKATQHETHRIERIYSNPAYNNWSKTIEHDKWSIDYYKGLGTSTYEEACEYLADIDNHTKEFFWAGDNDGRSIDVAFKTDITAKKKWLEEMPKVYIGRLNRRMSYGSFINEELIFAAQAILERSIPSVIDGFRLAQRKTVFSLFKREKEAHVNFEEKIKVTQLASYVSEHAAHHHCERSLSRTIIRMAQTFVGSNNVNMLEPIGQFGSRASGGKHDVDARYIHTTLSSVTRLLIHKDDDDILEYPNVFGKKRHPKWFLPIMPMVLVNGSQSVGMGWNSFIPSYDPRVISANIKRLLHHETSTPMLPWYRNFKGDIKQVSSNEYRTTGMYEVNHKDSSIHITELPVHVWTRNYLKVLERLKKDSVIEGYKNDSDNMSIDIKLSLSKEQMKHFLNEKNPRKLLRLSKTIRTNNMHLLNKFNVLTKYESPDKILEEFLEVRLKMYRRRKQHMVEILAFERDKLECKVAIFQRVLNGEINIALNLDAVLQEKGFKKYGKTINDRFPSYDYLTEDLMSMIRDPSKVDELMAELGDVNKRLGYYTLHTAETHWINELDAFDKALEGLEGFGEESSGSESSGSESSRSPIKKKTKLQNA